MQRVLSPRQTALAAVIELERKVTGLTDVKKVYHISAPNNFFYDIIHLSGEYVKQNEYNRQKYFKNAKIKSLFGDKRGKI